MTEDPFDSFMGNPSAAWLRAWRQVDIMLAAHGQGAKVKQIVCGAAMQAMDKLKNDTISQLQGDNFSRAHLMSNELIQLQKLIGQSCFGSIATQASRAQATPRPVSSVVGGGQGPMIQEDTEIV